MVMDNKRAMTHQADTKQLEVTEPDCCVVSGHLYMGQKVTLGPNSLYQPVAERVIQQEKEKEIQTYDRHINRKQISTFTSYFSTTPAYRRQFVGPMAYYVLGVSPPLVTSRPYLYFLVKPRFQNTNF